MDYPVLQIQVDLQIKPMVIPVTASADCVVDVGVESLQVVRVADEPYTGAYTFTPTNAVQTVPISGKTALSDIRINPIPNNYGLIGWNGSVLTVS